MPENQEPKLETTELIGLIEGTVRELKEYVRQNEFNDEQLKQILRAEVESKDRKTAKNFLRRQISDEEVIEEKPNSEEPEVEFSEPSDEIEIDREALLQMLGGTVEDVKEYVEENNPDDNQLQKLLHAEKMVKDRKTVVRFLKSYSKKKELEEEFHDAEHDLKSLKQDLKEIEENILEEDIELELDEIPEPEEDSDENKDQSEEETESEDVEEEAEEDEESEESEEESDETKDDEDDESDEEEAEDSEEDELSEMEKKKQILEDMEMEISDEELEQISLEELKKLKDEKKKREELIQKLSVKFERDQLEQLTTRDLEKLADEINADGPSDRERTMQQEQDAKAQKEKDEEELKKEAQQDLEMMMGAVKSDSDGEEDSEPGAIDQLKQLPDKFKGILDRGGEEEEEEETGFNEDKVIEVLEEYGEAGGREAAIKTAQVMKGYLEYALGIDREMTYAELADEMESRELDNQNIDTLIKFYRSMKISVYTGDVEADNIDEVLEASKAVVKEL